MLFKKIIVSCDDGHKLDLKLAKLLKQYNIPGIFFISNMNFELDNLLSPEDIKKLSIDFDIGGHTVSHPSDLKRLEHNDLVYQIAENKKYLEGIIGRRIHYFCYPKGRYNEDTIRVLKECGYIGARTTVCGNTDIPDIFENYKVKPTIHVYPENKRFKKPKFLQNAKMCYNRSITKKNGYFHIFMHSWEVEKFNMWNELEELFKYITNYEKSNI